MEKKRKIYLTESQMDYLIKNAARTDINESWKSAAVGAMMGLGVMGGMQSCTNGIGNNNAPIEQREQNADNDWYLAANQEQTIEASMFIITDRRYIKDLQLNTRQCKSMGANHFEWSDNNNYTPHFGWTTQNGDTIIDTYYVDGTVYDNEGQEVDASCYIEFYYSADDNKPMNDRAIGLRVYHNNQDRQDTEFAISLNTLKNNGGSNYLIQDTAY